MGEIFWDYSKKGIKKNHDSSIFNIIGQYEGNRS